VKYLVDTSTMIDFGRGIEPISSRLLALMDGPDEIGVCPVVVAEFYSGTPPERAPEADALFESLSYWGIAREDALQAGRYRFSFAHQGVQLGVPDALIAAVARANDATVISGNLKDFPMTDIQVVSLA